MEARNAPGRSRAGRRDFRSGGSAVVAPQDAIAQMRRVILAPASLLKTSADLNLAESGLFGDRKAEDFLASGEHSPVRTRLRHRHQGRIRAPAFDALIANHIARNVTVQPAAQANAAATAPSVSRLSPRPVSFLRPPSCSIRSRSLFCHFFSLLPSSRSALHVHCGLRAIRSRSRKTCCGSAARYLEQIDMLERMWPETAGRMPCLKARTTSPSRWN